MEVSQEQMFCALFCLGSFQGLAPYAMRIWKVFAVLAPARNNGEKKPEIIPVLRSP